MKMSNETKTKINFQNADQVTLWNNEIVGQLSDGYWENTRPMNHWRPWCHAVAMCEADAPIGRDFAADKDNYNLANKELLECVGGRMRAAVVINRLDVDDVVKKQLRDCANDFNEENLPLIDVDERESRVRTYATEDEGRGRMDGYWTKKRDETNWTLLRQLAVRVNATTYTTKELRKELNAMKQVIRTRTW